MGSHAFRVLSLCSGAGGLELGLKLAVPAARTVCYVEREAYACAVLAARMQDKTLDAAPVWSDLATFDGGAWRGRVHCITGGYPCQPFSVAGQQRGVDDPRHLWPHVARVVREVQPEWCFFENVANHLNLGYSEVRGELESMGYRVAEGLFTAAEVGAPHRRQRLFILANAGGAGPPPAWIGKPHPQHPHYLAGAPGCGLARKESLGDRHHPRLEGRSLRERGRANERPSRSAGGALALAEGFRRQDGTAPREQPAGPAGAGIDLPLFPPGPDDLLGWCRALAACPAVEPAVCGVADGLAYRVDRLRLCGNGVVPLAAAHAFRTLAARLGVDDE